MSSKTATERRRREQVSSLVATIRLELLKGGVSPSHLRGVVPTLVQSLTYIQNGNIANEIRSPSQVTQHLVRLRVNPKIDLRFATLTIG